MFVNKIPFFTTRTCNLKFGTVEALPDRKMSTVIEKLRLVIYMYHHCGF